MNSPTNHKQSVLRWIVGSLVLFNLALVTLLMSCRHYANAGRDNPLLTLVVPDGYRGPLFLDTRGATSERRMRIEVVFDGTGYAHVPEANDGFARGRMRFASGKNLSNYEEGPDSLSDANGVWYHDRMWESGGLLVDFVGTRAELGVFAADGGGSQRVAKILAKPPKSR